MEPAVEAFLQDELARFVANVFEVTQRGVRVGGEKGLESREGETGFFGIGETLAAALGFFEVRAEFLDVEALEGSGFFVAEKDGFDDGSDGGAGARADGGGSAQGSGGGGDGAQRGETARALALGAGVAQAHFTTDGFDGAVSFVSEGAAYVGDFVVNGFERDVGGHDARDVILQGGAEETAGDRDDKEPHQYASECAAEVEAAVEEDERKAEKAEPEMAPHPGLSTAEAPSGDAFARAEQGGKNHERKAEATEDDSDGAAAARA